MNGLWEEMKGGGGGGAVWVTMELKTNVISLSVTIYDSGWRGKEGEREREERERERENPMKTNVI